MAHPSLPSVLVTKAHRAAACPLHHASYGFASSDECLGSGNETFWFQNVDTGEVISVEKDYPVPPFSYLTQSLIVSTPDGKASIVLSPSLSGAFNQTWHGCAVSCGVSPIYGQYLVSPYGRFNTFAFSLSQTPPLSYNGINCSWGIMTGTCNEFDANCGT